MSKKLRRVLTEEYVKHLYDEAHRKFNYEDGKLIWKEPQDKKYLGKEAGTITSNSYRSIYLGGKLWGVHRIVFLMIRGYLPYVVDHLDRNKLNNRIENLADSTESANMSNTKMRSTNTSGYRWVYYSNDTRKYSARLKVDGKMRRLGEYSTPGEAHNVARDYFEKHYKDKIVEWDIPYTRDVLTVTYDIQLIQNFLSWFKERDKDDLFEESVLKDFCDYTIDFED